jgi:DNA polymerase I-like protein with 3'-5' exonuclease and polymerase domains
MVAQYLLSGQQVKQPSLNSLAEYYDFPLKLDQVKQMWAAGIQTRDIPADILIKYGDYDAVLTGKVVLEQAKRLTAKRMWSLMWTQMQELRMLKNAERAGMLLDLPYLSEQADLFEQDLHRKDRELLEISGNQIFNLNAPAQKAALFFGGTIKVKTEREIFDTLTFTDEDRLEVLSKGPKWVTFNRHVTGLKFAMPDKYPQGKTGPSVDATALSMLTPRTKEQRTALAIVKDRNTLSKMLSTYLRGLPKKVRDGSTVHTWFKQAWTITGRISSEDPNLMNIPRDKTGPVKRAFITRF